MNFHEVCNIYGYNKSGLGNLKEGTKRSINWNNAIVDTTISGRTVGVGIGYIIAAGAISSVVWGISAAADGAKRSTRIERN